MGVVLSLASGIISSLLAVSIVELYGVGRRRYRRRALKALLPDVAGRCTVVVPALPWVERSASRGLLTYDDASAFAYAIGAAHLVDTTVEVTSSRLASREASPALVCIGGPRVNTFTESLTAEHHPGLRLVEEGSRLYVDCGGRQFRDTPTRSYGFVGRLSSRSTGRGGAALLLWGLDGIGTIAAAYYFVDRITVLHQAFPDGDFLIAVEIDPRLGYKALPAGHVDLTAAALGAGGAASGGGVAASA